MSRPNNNGAARDALRRLLPPERITVPQYAEQHRWLGGGMWRNEETPYLIEPMLALDNPRYLTEVLVGPAQCGKTAVAENWMLKSVAIDPADFLWYMHTDEPLAAYVKDRINPMIDAHHELRDNLGLRPVDDSLHFKRFKRMKMQFLSATHSNFINKNAKRIVADEFDAFDEGLGDAKSLLDDRRQYYGDESKLLIISHPDRARGLMPERDWLSGVMRAYGDSDRRLWYWPCPDCGGYSSPNPLAERVMNLNYPADAPLEEIDEATRLECPLCGSLIEDRHRRAMNRDGKWIGLGQEIDRDGNVGGALIKTRSAGFWIVGAMSPYVLGGIGGLARERVKAERDAEISGDDATLRQVVVKKWGVPYAPPRAVGTVDAITLAERCEPDLPAGVVPEGVRFITAVFDVQIAHVDVLVRGWGAGVESWIIENYNVPGAPATDPALWDKILGTLVDKRYPLEMRKPAAGAVGSVPVQRQMAIRAIGFDSGGAPGVTDQAYAAWERARKGKQARLYGKIDGRDAWSILPLKGAAGPNAPRLNVVYPDTARRDRKVTHTGAVPLALFNPNSFKDDLAGQLGHAEPGPRYVHFPAALKIERQPPYQFFEQLVSERPNKIGRWEKINRAARNEKLDLMVMSHVVAFLHGITRINWERPPSWAAPWDKNSMVTGNPPATPDVPQPNQRSLGAMLP